MRIEHIAFNVTDPVAMALWYEKNLGMRVIRSGSPPANGRFIADSTGHVILEVYNNPPDAVPDYAGMDPLLFHIAFAVDDVAGTAKRLVVAGAKMVSQAQVLPSGDEIAMVRDPWGVAVQLLKRATPML